MRTYRGLTQHQLANKAGVAVSVITVAELSAKGPADEQSPNWRHSTAMKVYRALCSVTQLDADERELFKIGTGIRFLADGYDNADDLPPTLPPLAEAEMRELTKRLNTIYNQYGYTSAFLVLKAGLDLIVHVRSQAVEDWRNSLRQDEPEPQSRRTTTKTKAQSSGKPNLSDIDAMRHTVKSDAGVVDVYTPKAAAAPSPASKKSTRRTG